MKSSITISKNGNRIRATGAAANELFKIMCAQVEKAEAKPKAPVFSNCNVCGRNLIREDELAIGMCAICANEHFQPPPALE